MLNDDALFEDMFEDGIRKLEAYLIVVYCYNFVLHFVVYVMVRME